MATLQNKGPRMYVGPSLPGLGRHTVFTGEPLPHVEAMMERSAALRELFVPLESVTDARKAVAEKGSRLNVCAARVLAEFKK